MRLGAAFLALVSARAAAAAFACPAGSNYVPSMFQGSAHSPYAVITISATTLFVTPPRDVVGTAYCIMHTFVNPNAPTQAFLSIGNAANSAADEDVTCAFLEVGLKGNAAVYNLSRTPDGSDCPIGPGGAPFAGWRSPAPDALPACPPGGAALPRALWGEGALKDAEQSGNSHLLLDARALTTVEQGAIVKVRCAAAVAPAAGGATAVSFSNSAAAGAPVEACAWLEPVPPAHLRWKLGEAAACPTNFTGAATIPFTFAA